MKFSDAAQTDLYMTSKYCESYKEQMALYAFQSLSRYLDVIHRSVCSAASIWTYT